MPFPDLRRPRATAISAGIAATLTITLAGCGVLGGLAPALLDGGTLNIVGSVEFGTPLAVPTLAESTTDADGRRIFDLTAQPGEAEFDSGKVTNTWGFNQDYLGPTLA